MDDASLLCRDKHGCGVANQFHPNDAITRCRSTVFAASLGRRSAKGGQWQSHDLTLGRERQEIGSVWQIVTHVLVHEVGHHFGLSDDDMHAIEAGAG